MMCMEVKEEMKTIGTRLGKQMEDLVSEWGITAVTQSLINEVESHGNWRQTDNLKNLFSEYVTMGRPAEDFAENIGSTQ